VEVDPLVRSGPLDSITSRIAQRAGNPLGWKRRNGRAVEGGGLETRFRKPHKIQQILLSVKGLWLFPASSDFPFFHQFWTACSDKIVTVSAESTLR
jgi:hypothetical protein